MSKQCAKRDLAKTSQSAEYLPVFSLDNTLAVTLVNRHSPTNPIIELYVCLFVHYVIMTYLSMLYVYIICIVFKIICWGYLSAK